MKVKSEYTKKYADYERLRYQRRKKFQVEKQRRRFSTIEGRFKGWKYRAQKRGLEFSLDLGELMRMPMVCAYTGEGLTCKVGERNTVTLDRIDNSKGYLPGNVCFCTYAANTAKNDYSKEEFIQMCKMVCEHNGFKVLTHEQIRG